VGHSLIGEKVMTNEDFQKQVRESHEKWLSEGNLRSLEETFPPSEPDAPVLLFQGEAVAITANGDKAGDLKVELTWSPRPRVHFTLRGVEIGRNQRPQSAVESAFEEVGRDHLNAFSSIRPSVLTEPIAVYIESYVIDGYGPTTATFTGRIIENVATSTSESTRHALFQIPNFVRVLPAAGILLQNGGGYSGRTTLSALGWKITLDNVQKGVKTSECNRWAGFAITNVGRIEKEDGSTFQYSELATIRSGLGMYLSFCVGRWTDTARLTGFDVDGVLAWEEWRAPSADPHIECRAWLDPHTSAQFTTVFSNFMRLWADRYWGRVLNDVIHWYVSANGQSGAIEGSIVLLQNAFELLAAAVLVEHYKWIDNDAFGKLTAPNKLRLLFRWAGIPTEIPTSLAELSMQVEKQAKSENREIDGPSAIVWMRNKIVHPTEKNRSQQRSVGNDVCTEVWMLGLWYLEICLLKLVGHEGTYGSRLRHRWVGQVDPMPREFRNSTEFPLAGKPAVADPSNLDPS